MKTAVFSSLIFLVVAVSGAWSFSVVAPHAVATKASSSARAGPLFSKLSKKRRNQLGIEGDEDYDLSYALDANTDSLISKILVGSLTVVIIAFLVVAVINPLTANYDEGICSPIQNAGRC